MDERETLIIPQPNIWETRVLFGGFFLLIFVGGLFPIVRLIFIHGRSWDCLNTAWVIGIFVCLIAIFLQQLHEFTKQDLSLTTYWGIGLPIRKFFLKLPLIWRSYSGKKVTSLKIFRISRVDRDNYRKRITHYQVKAKIGRKMVNIASYQGSLLKALETAWKIGEFLGIPVDESGL